MHPPSLCHVAVSALIASAVVCGCQSDDVSDAKAGSGGAASSSGGISAGTGAISGTGAFTGTGAMAGSSTGGQDGEGEGWLGRRYPGDVGLAEDPAVLFFDDFEEGWGRWDWPLADTSHLFVEEGDEANGGRGYLRSTVTEQQLEVNEYISASPRVLLPERVETLYTRFHVRFPVVAPNPHHWIRFSAGTEDFQSSGLANTVPAGDQGFWFDFDANLDDVFNFYVYWHAMRSGRCNDGTAVPGCAGDQGTTYYYGNVFQPRDQAPFPRDRWFCIEIEAHAGPAGTHEGALSFYIDDELVGGYGPGYPVGTWLRSTFHEGGCTFSACTEPAPFEGFEFRTTSDVLFKEFFLDAYYERNTTANNRTALEERGITVSDQQTILYDDIVIATERIGCRTPP